MLRLHQVLGLWVGHSCGPASDVALVLDLGVEGERRRAEPLPLWLCGCVHQRGRLVVVDPVQCRLPARDPREAEGPLRSVGQVGEFVEQKGKWCPKFAV